MHADNLPQATKLAAELKLWNDALNRCQYGIFDSAHLRVVDAAHGHQGQSGETIVALGADDVRAIAEHHIARVTGELREIGVEI